MSKCMHASFFNSCSRKISRKQFSFRPESDYIPYKRLRTDLFKSAYAAMHGLVTHEAIRIQKKYKAG